MSSLLAAATLAMVPLLCHAAPRSESRLTPSHDGGNPAESSAAPTTAPALTRADLDQWLDGFLPTALSRADIAGAVVIVVRNGAVLSERGYGYADVASGRRVDPSSTLFRPGSISKLFTWTAVMQLVEQRKLDLDSDVNRYLDFQVPLRDGKPLTLRDLMTHTSGFEDRLKYLFADDPSRRISLGDYLKRTLPARIYPAGEVPAYSNYAAAMGGYIVERVSGEPFEAYVERHILGPLGMRHSSFREPVPQALAADLSRGYERSSRPPKPDEIVGPAPAGALSATGEDMARFMIAHLGAGTGSDEGILKPDTLREMHTPQRTVVPPLRSWALGFLADERNGHAIIQHDGDTIWFHSRLMLMPDDGVGVYVSLNSRRNDDATTGIRRQLVRGFMDRYFPPNAARATAPATIAGHAEEMAGSYRSTQRAATSFLAIASLLMAVDVAAAPDGTIRVSNVTDPSGDPAVLREVAPDLWQSDFGDRVAAIRRDGRVTGFGIEGDLYAAYERPPAILSPSWNVPLALGTLAILMVSALFWPVLALVRRRRRPAGTKIDGRPPLRRLVQLTVLVDLAAVATYAGILRKVVAIRGLDDRMDLWIRLGQGLSLLGLVGAFISVWSLLEVWRDDRATCMSKAHGLALAVACMGFGWFALTLRLIFAGTQF